ncbi:MAG TPA: hypothetical protein VEG34_04780, partial [Thermoanaerobaculia bacterium]|nr:hypothetical protein [Thermoanaerobaculia bacterium]
MGDRPRIDLYCEDDGHEQVARALLGRSARELGLPLSVRTVSGRGGHGRAIEEFKTWQRVYSRGGIADGTPDLLILMIDANCTGWAE